MYNDKRHIVAHGFTDVNPWVLGIIAFLSYIEQCVIESGVQQSYSFYDSQKGGRQWRIGLHMCMYRHITPPPHTHTLKKQECTSK